MKKHAKTKEEVFKLVYRHWKSNLPKIDEPCPDEETLACFVDGLLDKEEEEKVTEHLLRCSRCMGCVVFAVK